MSRKVVCDIKRQKDDIRKFLASSDSGALNKRKTIKGSTNTKLDAAVYKWFNRERSMGMPLGGDAVKTDTDKFVQKMNLTDFRAKVRDFQINKCGVKRNDVKALLLVDNDPAHVELDTLASHVGRIKFWDEVKESTLRNCWKKLLLLDHADEVTEEEMDFEGFSNDIYQELHAAGEVELTLYDVEEWLDIDAVDPPIGHLTDDEIIQNVTGTVDDDGEEDEDEHDSSLQSATCADALFYVEKLLDIVSQTDNPELPGFYQHLRMMNDICLKDMTKRRKQTKMSQYFS
ncbi:jerky protein homolog-like [Procambarus clarkii]|uniref:jerky protein homolog-like n=1 Tax=Procambarus clarkii TaxID=6728 RepID=UPI003741E91A